MTFEEAERFRWNPFDLTKVRLLRVKLCSGYIYTAMILQHQASWKNYHRWWLGGNSLFKVCPDISVDKLRQTTKSAIKGSVQPCWDSDWFMAQSGNWLAKILDGNGYIPITYNNCSPPPPIKTGRGVHLACWTVGTSKSYLLDEAVKARSWLFIFFKYLEWICGTLSPLSHTTLRMLLKHRDNFTLPSYISFRY